MRPRPPGPVGEPLFGNSRQYADDPFRFMRDCADAYGDVVRFDLGPRETYMLTNPRDVERVLVSEVERYRKFEFGDPAVRDLLGEGLLVSEGETWKRQRELAGPSFHARRLAGLTEMMASRAEATVANWEPGDRIDFHGEVARLTVRIIVNAMFGTDVDERTVRLIQENLEPLGARFEPDPRRVLLPDWVPTRENLAFEAAVAALEGIIDELIAERRGSEYDAAVDPASDAIGGGDVAGSVPGADVEDAPVDLLSVLLRARARGEQTDENLRDELMTMLLAGHDTTALTLTYAFYLLSEHPEVRERLETEVDAVVGDETPGFDHVRDMKFVGYVLDEAMRLYPPVYALFREPKLDAKHGGYRIPEGSALMLPQWVIHRSDRWYDDPEAFDPDRWAPGRRRERPRFAFFPFGAGPRRCIGKQFSLLEAKLIVAAIAREYRLDYAGPEMELRGSLTMHPRHPVDVEVRRR